MWVLILIFSTIVTVYYICLKKYDYWKKRKVPHLKPTLIFGNYGEFILLKNSIGDVLRKVCEQLPNEPYIGTFYGTKPALIVKDPELIKSILTKDFYYFNGREVSDHTERETLTKGIFFSHGDKWKVVRQNLSPLYTTAKMKNMFYLMEKCSRILESALEEQIKVNNIVNVSCLMSRFSLECVAMAAFGLEVSVMRKDFENNEFKKMSERIFEKSTYRGIKNIFRAIWPDIFYGLGFQSYPQELSDFFSSLMHQVFKQRNFVPSKKHDFVDLILEFANKEYLEGDSMLSLKTGEIKKISLKIDESLLSSQCLTFLGAGYETSAVALYLTLFEMAKNEHTQERAFKEIDEYLSASNNVLNYDCVFKLPYLEACIDESLRMYPSLGNLTREVREAYNFPTGLYVEKGLRIHIPVTYLHYNPVYFPEPEKFLPDRFLPEEKHKIHPFTYLPFGEGYRFCVGKRFAKMQIISGLVTIFKSYRIELAEGQPLTIKFDPRIIINRPTNDINLKFIPRENSRKYLRIMD